MWETGAGVVMGRIIQPFYCGHSCTRGSCVKAVVSAVDAPDQVVPAMEADFEDEAAGGEMAHSRYVPLVQVNNTRN